MDNKPALQDALKDTERKKEHDNLYNQVIDKRSRPEPTQDGMAEINEEMDKETMLDTKPATYEYHEAVKMATEYFDGDSLAAGVWVNKYALKDSDGNLYELTPDDMHTRIAKEIARIEKRYPNPMDENTVFNLLKGFHYIVPQGSPMAGIGNPFQIGSLSNCFVIGNKGEAGAHH